MNTEELKRLAEAATPGPWAAAISSNMVNSVCATFETICETGKNIDDALYIAAANPAAILELIRQRDELLVALKALDRGCRDPRCIGVLHGLDLARTAIAKAEG